ncbi:hypothetical protein [Streptomyces botrytidirepellens]|uniref:hypothetical protein n=1 Tax=Streptomyces botrytidirepellens TaxID=2486417 RepID=UPI0011CE9263|nr:hypothetical protein [Streptomyces botrytidirepellens]
MHASLLVVYRADATWPPQAVPPGTKLTQEGEDDRRSAGMYPAHLPLTYKPELVEQARPREIRDDYGIRNAVFAPDTRYIFRDTSFPWCTAGRVETAGGSCTGTMIGRRLMVTGSHCMQWTGRRLGQVHARVLQRSGAIRYRLG